VSEERGFPGVFFGLFVGVRVSGGTSSLHFAADRNAVVTESIKQEGGGFFGLCVGVGSPSLFITPASLPLSLSLPLSRSLSLPPVCWCYVGWSYEISRFFCGFSVLVVCVWRSWR
jgi:hypothetical protein